MTRKSYPARAMWAKRQDPAQRDAVTHHARMASVVTTIERHHDQLSVSQVQRILAALADPRYLDLARVGADVNETYDVSPPSVSAGQGIIRAVGACRWPVPYPDTSTVLL